MKFKKIISSLLIFSIAFGSNIGLNTVEAQSVVSATDNTRIDSQINTATTDLVSVVVELNQKPVYAQIGKSEQETYKLIEKEHNDFKKFLDKSKSKNSIKITQEFYYTTNALAITLPGTEVKNLLNSGIVKKVWFDTGTKNGTSSSSTKVENSSLNSVSFLNVDDLHKDGVAGKVDGKTPIKVGIIDTGIDYNHPDLTKVYMGARNESYNINQVIGWDFVDGDSDPMEATYGDWLEENKKTGVSERQYNSEYYTKHGTHVAGVVGSSGNLTGIAPEVELYGYRVVGPYEKTTLSWILGGVEKSALDDMDVVNMSLAMGDAIDTYLLSNAVNNAVLSGVTVCTSAGNYGANGKSSIVSPTTAPLSISVGASSLPMERETADIEVKTGNGTIYIMDADLVATDNSKVTNLGEKELIDVGFASANELEEKSLKGEVALIDQGSGDISVKVKGAKKAGAVAVVLLSGSEVMDSTYIGSSDEYCPTYKVTYKDSEDIKEKLRNSGNGLVTFSNESSYKKAGDELAVTSSKGPVSNTYDIKPDVVAPGISIYSTVPGKPVFDSNGKFTGKYDYTNAYQMLSGTSMAAPQVTGIAALILSQHPDYTPADVKAAIMNTAVPLAQENLSVYEEGAGRVDAYRAVHSDVLIKSVDTRKTYEDGIATDKDVIEVERGSINFGAKSSNDKISLDKNMVIENNSKTSKNFTTKVEYNESRVSENNSSEINSSKDNGVVLKVPSTITVKNGEVSNFVANITVPNTAKTGTYEGYVYFTDSKTKEEYRVPFAFVKN